MYDLVDISFAKGRRIREKKREKKNQLQLSNTILESSVRTTKTSRDFYSTLSHSQQYKSENEPGIINHPPEPEECPELSGGPTGTAGIAPSKRDFETRSCVGLIV